MICEPNLSLPQHIDINLLRDKPVTQTQEKQQLSNLNFFSHVSTEYNVLPVFVHQHFDVNVLSLKHNEYLLMRWNKFLENKPDDYVRIELYMDFKTGKTIPKARRMQLTGQFYGVDNKLAPIPLVERQTNVERQKRNRCKPERAAEKKLPKDDPHAAVFAEF